MPNTKFNAAVANCSITQADDFAREGWKSWASGRLSDRDVGELQDVVDARKRLIRASIASQSEHPPATARRRPARTQDRQRSILRRRRLATSGVVPNQIAAHFTQGETSVLSVVGKEIRKNRNNRCELTIAAIAAMGGVCPTVVRSSLRQAQHLDIIRLTERRRAARRSLPNVITITSLQWRTWLKLGGEGALLRTPRITREIKGRRSRFVHVDAKAQHSQSDPTRTLVRGLPRHGRETSCKSSEGTD